MEARKFLIFSFLSFSTCWALPEQSLNVTLTSSRLPIGRTGLTAFFDGDDDIFLFGDGYQGTQDILKYTVSTDSLTILGKSPFPESRAVGAFRGPNPELIYVAVHSTGGAIFTFNPNTLETEVVAGPGIFFMESRAIIQTDDTNFVYFFGGIVNPQNLIKFDLINMNFTRTDDLPIMFWTPCGVSMGNNEILIFGNTTQRLGDERIHVWKYNTVSGASQLDDPVVEVAFKTDVTGHFAVWDNGTGNAYIIGSEGFRLNKEAILQYNAEKGEFKAWNVQYIEGNDNTGLASSAVAFVPKLNRIYIFGGQFKNTEYSPRTRDEIWYIDMNQIN